MYQIIWFRCFIISLYWVQPHLHLYRIMVQFWKLQILRRIRNTEDKKSGFGENWKLIFLGDIWRDLCVHKSLVVMSAISIIIWFVEIFVFFVEQKLINHRRLWRILETPKMSVLSRQVKIYHQFICTLCVDKFIIFPSRTCKGEQVHFQCLFTTYCYSSPSVTSS